MAVELQTPSAIGLLPGSRVLHRYTWHSLFPVAPRRRLDSGTLIAGACWVVVSTLIAVFRPDTDAGLARLALGGALTGLCAGITYVASEGLLERRLQRLAVSVPVVIAPVAVVWPRWLLLYVAFWVLLWLPASLWGLLLAPAVLAVAGFADQTVLVLLPLAVLRLWARRDRGAVAAVVALAAGTATGVLIGPADDWHAATTATPAEALRSLGGEPMRTAVFGDLWTGGDAPALVAAAVVMLGVVLAVARATRPRWSVALAGTAVAVAAFFWSAMVAGHGAPPHVATAALLTVGVLAALLGPTRDLMVPEGAGLREVAPWLPIFGLVVLTLVAGWANVTVG